MVTHETYSTHGADGRPVWHAPDEVVRDEAGARLTGRHAGRDRPSTARCRSRRRTWSTPTTSSPATAPTPRAGSCCPTARPSATSNGPPPAPRPRTGTSARVWRLARRERRRPPRPTGRRTRALLRATHRAIRDVTADIEGFAFNKAIARLYELTGAIGKRAGRRAGAARRAADAGAADGADDAAPGRGGLGDGWAARGWSPRAPWPEADPALLVEASVTLPVQVNGKRRAEIAVPAGSDAATIEALVLAGSGGAPGAERRGAAAADRGARPDRECGGLTAATAAGRPRRARARRLRLHAALRRRARRRRRWRAGSRWRCIDGAPGFAMRERLTARLGAGRLRRPTGSTIDADADAAPASR